MSDICYYWQDALIRQLARHHSKSDYTTALMTSKQKAGISWPFAVWDDLHSRESLVVRPTGRQAPISVYIPSNSVYIVDASTVQQQSSSTDEKP